MKNLLIIAIVLSIALLTVSCSNVSETSANATNGTSVSGTATVTSTAKDSETSSVVYSVPEIDQTGMTKAVPEEYMTEATQKGTVERLDYVSEDYVRDGSEITKTAYVYLPYGYDGNDKDTRYNILYLSHGWGGHAGEQFELPSLKNMFDNLIEKGDITPLIIVSVTFYNENSNYDFNDSIEEFRQFHNDFEDHLMALVESKYNTYAENTTPEGLKASRDHRAFGGFSLGSVTTWLQFCYEYDYIRYFIPMSGSCWYYGTYGDFQIKKNVDFIEELVRTQNLDERGYFIYHAVGTEDTVKSQSLDMADEMLSREIFTPDHYVFYQKEGGYHDYDAVSEFLYNALPLFWGGEEIVKSVEPFTRDTLIQDVINYPGFDNFGRLIFPVNETYYSGNTLNDLNLTWYTEIRPEKTVEICNFFKDHTDAGETIFYDIYTDEEKAADPSKADTGLFFFKGKPGAGTAVCNAGGGFSYVGAMHDSFPHALELSKMGYNAFALIYRPGWDTAMEDLGRAIVFLYDNTKELGIDMHNYSLWGGSAGARMAATLGNSDYLSYYTGRTDIPQANAVIMQYTGHSDVSSNDAPTYACTGTSDGIANYKTMENRLKTLTSNYAIPTEFHAYDGLGHGFGLGTGTVAEGWINDAVSFWEKNS